MTYFSERVLGRWNLTISVLLIPASVCLTSANGQWTVRCSEAWATRELCHGLLAQVLFLWLERSLGVGIRMPDLGKDLAWSRSMDSWEQGERKKGHVFLSLRLRDVRRPENREASSWVSAGLAACLLHLPAYWGRDCCAFLFSWDCCYLWSFNTET